MMTKNLFYTIFMGLLWTYSDADVCRKGWIPFNGSCYYLSGNKLNWKNAAAFCYGKGAHLVRVESEREHSFLRLQARIQNDKQIYYIDGTDLEKDGSWIWSTSQKITFSKWMKGEPNGKKTENCITMHDYTTYEWADVACSREEKFICETKMMEIDCCRNFLIRELLKCKKA